MQALCQKISRIHRGGSVIARCSAREWSAAGHLAGPGTPPVQSVKSARPRSRVREPSAGSPGLLESPQDLTMIG